MGVAMCTGVLLSATYWRVVECYVLACCWVLRTGVLLSAIYCNVLELCLILHWWEKG